MQFKWCSTGDCSPPHRVTHEEKLEKLIRSLQLNGWQGPALIGYLLDGRIQLISGSHRFAAAVFLNMEVPVWIYDYEYISRIYGTGEWVSLLSSQLDKFEVRTSTI